MGMAHVRIDMAQSQSQSRTVSQVERLRLALPEGVEVVESPECGDSWHRDGEVMVTDDGPDTLFWVHQAGYRVSQISGDSILVVPQ